MTSRAGFFAALFIGLFLIAIIQFLYDAKLFHALAGSLRRWRTWRNLACLAGAVVIVAMAPSLFWWVLLAGWLTVIFSHWWRGHAS